MFMDVYDVQIILHRNKFAYLGHPIHFHRFWNNTELWKRSIPYINSANLMLMKVFVIFLVINRLKNVNFFYFQDISDFLENTRIVSKCYYYVIRSSITENKIE